MFYNHPIWNSDSMLTLGVTRSNRGERLAPPQYAEPIRKRPRPRTLRQWQKPWNFEWLNEAPIPSAHYQNLRCTTMQIEKYRASIENLVSKAIQAGCANKSNIGHSVRRGLLTHRGGAAASMGSAAPDCPPLVAAGPPFCHRYPRYVDPTRTPY
ncbi:hypothetical protein F4824DRAFT_332663 [Ustulina deusta]|nr:hypothetical protein F4824DRAFT_332663 [Ustulina deusta]